MIRPAHWIRGLLISLLLGTSSSANALNGTELLTNCQQALSPNPDPLESGLCFGYMQGALAGLEVAKELRAQASPNILNRMCVPDDVTNSQLARLVVRYLEANPAQLHEPPLLLFLRAMLQGFPCRR